MLLKIMMFFGLILGLLGVAMFMHQMLAPLITDTSVPLRCRVVAWVEQVPHTVCVGKNLAGNEMVRGYTTREAYERLRVLADQLPDRVQWIDKPR